MNIFPAWALWLVIGLAAITTYLACNYDQIRKSVVLFYDMEPDFENAYEELHASFNLLKESQKIPSIWETEMSGVLNKALEGLQRLIKRGKFDEPKDCIKGRHEFLAHANPLYAFLQDRFEKSPDGKMKVQTFKEALVLWAKDQGVVVNKDSKKLIRKLRGLENTFGFKVTKPEDMKKVAYPHLYGLVFKTAADDSPE